MHWWHTLPVTGRAGALCTEQLILAQKIIWRAMQGTSWCSSSPCTSRRNASKTPGLNLQTCRCAAVVLAAAVLAARASALTLRLGVALLRSCTLRELHRAGCASSVHSHLISDAFVTPKLCPP